MMKIKITALLVVIALLPRLAAAQKTAVGTTPIVTGKDVAVVQTKSGKVRGYIHNGIFTYKGIPYATAERFMPPKPVAAWEGVRSSMSYGPVCPLMDPTTAVQDESEFLFHHDWGFPNENCLVANVWTPGVATKNRPVMVWLHGGGHSAGSSQELPSTDGENLARSGDVVVVSINHRLNIIGFLNLAPYGDKYKHSANVGMIDIVTALEWVKANIASFGGDPNNVTIFGQSGGGGKVNTLLNAPSAKGLFHKAIIQSGGLGLKFHEQALTKRVSAAVLAELHLQPSQVDSLQTISYEKLAAAGNKAMAKVNAELRTEGKVFGPFGMMWGPGQDATFLPHQPSDDAAKALSTNIPLLIGSTKNEFMASLFVPGLRDGNVEAMKGYLQKIHGNKTDAFIAALRKAYPADTRPTDLIDVDLMFRRSAIKMAELKATANSAPVYMYLFAWQSPVVDGAYKAVHCMEIAFAFNSISRCEEMTGGGKDAHALAEKVSQAWINFARTGNPNHKGLPKWQPYTPANGATMILDNVPVEKYHHDKEVLAIAPDITL